MEVVAAEDEAGAEDGRTIPRAPHQGSCKGWNEKGQKEQRVRGQLKSRSLLGRTCGLGMITVDGLGALLAFYVQQDTKRMSREWSIEFFSSTRPENRDRREIEIASISAPQTHPSTRIASDCCVSHLFTKTSLFSTRFQHLYLSRKLHRRHLLVLWQNIRHRPQRRDAERIDLTMALRIICPHVSKTLHFPQRHMGNTHVS